MEYVARKLSSYTTITIEAYVAAKDRDGKLLDSTVYAAAVASVERAMCELTGGACTSYGAQGVWRGLHEPVRVIRGSVPAARLHDALDSMAAALGAVGAATNQDVSGFTVDGEWYAAVAAPHELALVR